MPHLLGHRGQCISIGVSCSLRFLDPFLSIAVSESMGIGRIAQFPVAGPGERRRPHIPAVNGIDCLADNQSPR